MNEKVKQYQLRLFNKLFSTLPSVKKLNIINNELNLKEAINHIYYSHNKNFWFSNGETDEKYVFIFGLKDKPIHQITPSDASLIIDFDKNKQFNDNSLGIFSNKDYEINILINNDFLNEKYSYLNTNSFKHLKLQSLDKEFTLNVLDLGSINNDFINNLVKLLQTINSVMQNNYSQKENSTGDVDGDLCKICLKNKNHYKLDSNISNLKNIKPHYCGKCIEKIVVTEFYDKVKPLINGNDTKSLNVTKEKFGNDQLFDYGVKLLERYKIIRYIGIKREYFSFDTNPKIVNEFRKYCDKNNLLIDNIVSVKDSKPKSKNNKIDMRHTTLTRKTISKMNLFINSLKSGKTHSQAYKIAKTNKKKVENWYQYGRNGDENYIPFYEEYKAFRPENIERNKRMEQFLNSLKKDLNIDKALEKSGLTNPKVRAWYSIGEKGNKEYEDFYLECNKLLPNGIPQKKSTKIVDNDKLMNEFVTLIEDGKSNNEAIEQLKIPKFKIKNWINQGKLGNKRYIDFYNVYMIEINKEKEGKKIKTPIVRKDEKTSKDKTCNICGRNINKKSSKDICKRCARKQYASKILIKLLNSINPEIPFKKDDLKALGFQNMQITDYIWTLQEFNLIDKENNKFKLKDRQELEKFIKESGLEIDEIKTDTSTIKLSKTCKKCGKTLEISKFFPLHSNEDGYEDNCKDCKKLIATASYLKEMLQYVDYNQNFSEEELKQFYTDPFKLKAKIWSLLENDLIINNFEENTYTLSNKETIEEFLNKYYEEKAFSPEIKTDETIKNPKDYSKQDQMKIVIKAISEGKSRQKAADEANIPLYKINHWYKEGKQGFGKDNIHFYKQIKGIEKINKTKISAPENKMKLILADLENGKNIQELENISEIEVENWISKGKQDIKPYREFYEKYNEIIVNRRADEIIEYNNKEINRKIFFENFKTGKNKEESAKNADLELSLVHAWYLKGKDKQEPYIDFFDKYIKIKNNRNESVIPKLDKFDKFGHGPTVRQMNLIIGSLATGKSEKEAVDEANISFDTYYYWLNRGKQEFGELYTQFYYYINKIKSGEIKFNEEEPIQKHSQIISNENSEIETLDKIPENHILSPLPKEYEDSFKSTKTNKTGIAWVNQTGTRWTYSRQVNGKSIVLSADTIYELHEKVIANNLIWGIRNYEKASKIIDIPEEYAPPQKPEEKTTEDEIDFSGIYQPLPDEYEQTFKSTKTNKTGIAWVNKIGNRWVYSRSVNGKTINLSDNDIYGLYKQVVKNNLIWGIRDYSKTKDIIEIPDDFKIPKDKIHEKEPKTVNTDIYAHLSDQDLSKFNPNLNNKTGIAWVNRIGNKWIYQKQRNGKQIRITDSDIYKLHEKVINNNQPWGIIDINKAKKVIESETIEEKSDIIIKTTNIPSNVQITHIKKSNNKNYIIIKGIIEKSDLINVLNQLKIFEEDIKRIMTTSINQGVDLFIELELNNHSFNQFRNESEKIGWKIDS